LHNGLYFCQTEDPAAFDDAETIPGPSTEAFGALAKELGVALVLSLFERRMPGLYHNTAVVIERDGGIAGKYRKMHIPDDPAYYEKILLHARRPRLRAHSDVGRQTRCAGVLGPVVSRGGAADGAGRRGPADLPYGDRLGAFRPSRRESPPARSVGHGAARARNRQRPARGERQPHGFEPDPSGATGGIQFWAAAS
jgi:N-carbamoylputrescine amidase